jgi:Fur family peroxide stress response transcriptional regulator
LATDSFRWTSQRRAVLEELRAGRDHPTAAQIYERVRKHCPKVSCGTVYRALRFLAERGEILELKFAANASRFDRFPQPHHHALCVRCGRLVDVDLLLPEDTYDDVARQTGFEITDHRAEFRGLCPECR